MSAETSLLICGGVIPLILCFIFVGSRQSVVVRRVLFVATSILCAWQSASAQSTHSSRPKNESVTVDVRDVFKFVPGQITKFG